MKNNDYQDFNPDGIVLREVKTTEQRSKRENPRIKLVLSQSIATIPIVPCLQVYPPIILYCKVNRSQRDKGYM